MFFARKCIFLLPYESCLINLFLEEDSAVHRNDSYWPLKNGHQELPSHSIIEDEEDVGYVT